MDAAEGEDAEAGEAVERTQQKTTTKYMTKYERARILGTRALQIRYSPELPLHGHMPLRDLAAQCLPVSTTSLMPS